MTPRELKERLDKGERVTVLDVREPQEFSFANIGGTLIPLGELTQRYQELDATQEIVVLCHHGVRSAQATAFLRQQGFTNVSNLSGGIDRWSIEVDPTLRRY